MSITEMIPVVHISDPPFNSRVTPDDKDEYAALVTSIKKDGVRTPIRVRQSVGTDGMAAYVLVYGSRRLKASRDAGMTVIPAVVEPPVADLAGTAVVLDQMVDNIRENMARRDLTPYEQARSFAALREHGLKLDDVVARVGVSKGYVSNLTTIYLTADSIIITEWSKGNPAATVGYLRGLVSEEKDKAKQVVLFREHEAQLKAAESEEKEGEEQEEEEKEEKAPRNAPADKYHVEKARYRLLAKRLKAKQAPAMALQAIKYLVGEITKIPNVIEDPKEDEG